MKTAMCTKLLQYYNHNVQSSEILNIAAFLDPCFKSLSFLEDKSAGKICNLLPVQGRRNVFTTGPAKLDYAIKCMGGRQVHEY